MTTLIRTTFGKVVSPVQGGKIAGCAIIQKRDIMGKALRESLPPRPPKPAPFDYVNKDYTWFRSLFDRTTHRLDENSKVVVVEGPVAAGKTQFASALAADLGMKHFPEANMDIHYIQQGVDLRTFNDRIPPDTRTFDHIDFNECPVHRLAGNYQIMMYMARVNQYIDALTHLLNTGQGVVLERSPFSDFVFLEAMYSQKYLSRGVRSVYYELRNQTIEDLLRPHLIIYLDIPVNKVQEAIKKRGHKHEVCGKALTPAFLQEIERHYKNQYLRDISTHAELLVYDWSGGGEVEVVVEDIERLDFDQYVHRDEPKMKDWRLPREVEWSDQRMIFTNNKHIFMNLFNIPRTDVPELIISADDMHVYTQVLYGDPRLRFLQGYNADAGDTGLALRNKLPKYTEYF